MKETAAAQRGEERKSEINNFNFLCYIGHWTSYMQGKWSFQIQIKRRVGKHGAVSTYFVSY
jgi:hypothetical protein